MELRYLLKGKTLIFIILLFAGNLLLFYKGMTDKECIYSDEKGFSYRDYVKYYNECIQYINDEAGSRDSYVLLNDFYLDKKSDDNNEVISQVRADVKEQLDYIYGYDDEIAEKISQADKQIKINLYKKGSFGYNNLLKGKYDLKKLENVKLQCVPLAAERSVVSYKYVSYFVTIIMIILVWKFKNTFSGFGTIVKSSRKGRLFLALKRFGILILISVLSTLIMYVGIIFSAFIRYGGTEVLKAAIQSDSIFRFSLLKINHLQFFLLLVFSSVLSSLAAAGLTWLFLLVFRDRVEAVVGLVIFMLVEFVLYRITYNNLIARFFKYINIFNFLNLSDRIIYSENWGLGKYLISSFALSVIGMIVTIIIVMGVNMWISSGIWSGIIIESELLKSFIKKIKRKTAAFPVWAKEFKKILFVQKNIVVIAGILGFSVIYEFGVSGISAENRADLMAYYDYAQGEPYEKTDNYIKDIDMWLEGANKSLSDMGGNLIAERDMKSLISKKQELKSSIESQRDRARQLIENGEKNIRIVDDAKVSARYGMRVNIYNMNIFVVLLIFAIFASVRIFRQENNSNMDVIIRSCKNGNSFIWKKTVYMIITVGITAAVTFIIQSISINRAYPMETYEWQASIQSIEMFKNIGINITFLQMEIISLTMRILILAEVTFITIYMSLILDESVVTFLGILILLPYILENIGITLLNKISIVGIFANYEIFKSQTGITTMVIFMLGFIGIGVVTCIKGVHKWKMY